jgi:L-ascorbate metabolism protein UlaG (beta-lactamase superfamily)
MNNIDLLLISHPHADHVDKQAREALPKIVHMVGPAVNKAVFEGWRWTGPPIDGFETHSSKNGSGVVTYPTHNDELFWQAPERQ